MAGLPAVEVMRMALHIAGYVPRESYDEILGQSLEAINEKTFQDQGVDLLSSVKQLCEAIQDGQYTFSWGNAEYDGRDWYGDDEALYDRDHLGPELERCLRAAMDDVKHARYEEAIQVLDALFSIEVEIEDYDTASLESLFEQSVINLDYEETLRQYAYAVMMHCRDHERLSRLFEIERLHQYSLTMQEIENVSPAPFPNRDVFAVQWVQYLLERDLTRYQELIINAVTYQGGTEALEAFALSYGAQYPKAYIHLLENYLSARRFDDAIRIIEDGFTSISGVNPYRTKMADMLAEIGQATDDEALYKKGVEEAFHASVDIEHFLTLHALRDEPMLTRAMRQLEIQHSAQTGSGHPFDYYYIHFLHGDYDLVWEACRKDTNALGWTGSVKGKMMPLFVALLADTKAMSRCTKKFLEDQFSRPYHWEDPADRTRQVSKAYVQALCASYEPLSPDALEQYRRWCVQEAEARVQAVVGGQHRGSYGKASVLIVSIAEAMLARGDACGAAEFVIEYKEKYPRHTAFHRCLREDIKLSALNVSL